MKIHFSKHLLIVLWLLSSHIFAQEINLKKQHWNLTSPNNQIHINNANPSDVHLSLLEAQIIGDPFDGDIEEKLQWIGNQNWEYSCDFIVDSILTKSKLANLIFDGLDTYADVYLNDSLILQANNMFIKWETNIKTILKPGKNSLKILFISPIKINQLKAKSIPYKLPDERAFTRKAAYQFGWDWGPKYVTMGIWKDARILFRNEEKISDLYIKQDHLSKNIVKLEVITEIDSPNKTKVNLNIFLNNNPIYNEQITVGRGKSKVSIPIEIKNPKLWWPNGLGPQNFYEIKVEISSEKGLVDKQIVKTGLRNIEIIQEKDSIGQSFKFRINGHDIFVKGANYIPQDNFLSRVNQSDYKQIINTAVESNMNMLRVWGGGIYENDEFYKLCDENGIMVWQDFMFAGNMYPNDSQFIQSIKTEAIQNVKQLRNHASIVLWCGNNEISEAWYNWGWQNSFSWSPQDSTELWNNYLNIFENILPEIVDEYSGGTFYWPSSPSNGWGRDIAYKEGDVHYWGVWWGKEPFEKYNEKVGRFMSEYGFQGMPDLKTIESFAETKDLHIDSDVMKAHQKHPFGWENIQEYMKHDYPTPQNFENLVYLSQLMQAEGIKIAIEAHRRAKPYCMGTLYWQLNDCWPVTSWSSVDYHGRWKALQYFTKKAFEKYLISFEQNMHSLDVYFISDDTTTFEAEVIWRLIDFNGNTISNGKHKLGIDKNSSSVIKYFDKEEIEEWGPLKNKIILVDVFKDSKKIATAIEIIAKANKLNLHSQKPDFELLKTNNGYLLTFKSTHFLKGLQISCSEDGFFSNNYFDLIPNEDMSLLFKTKSTSLNKDNFSFIYLEN